MTGILIPAPPVGDLVIRLISACHTTCSGPEPSITLNMLTVYTGTMNALSESIIVDRRLNLLRPQSNVLKAQINTMPQGELRGKKPEILPAQGSLSVCQ